MEASRDSAPVSNTFVYEDIQFKTSAEHPDKLYAYVNNCLIGVVTVGGSWNIWSRGWTKIRSEGVEQLEGLTFKVSIKDLKAVQERAKYLKENNLLTAKLFEMQGKQQKDFIDSYFEKSGIRLSFLNEMEERNFKETSTPQDVDQAFTILKQLRQMYPKMELNGRKKWEELESSKIIFERLSRLESKAMSCIEGSPYIIDEYTIFKAENKLYSRDSSSFLYIYTIQTQIPDRNGMVKCPRTGRFMVADSVLQELREANALEGLKILMELADKGNIGAMRAIMDNTLPSRHRHLLDEHQNKLDEYQKKLARADLDPLFSELMIDGIDTKKLKKYADNLCVCTKDPLIEDQLSKMVEKLFSLLMNDSKFEEEKLDNLQTLLRAINSYNPATGIKCIQDLKNKKSFFKLRNQLTERTMLYCSRILDTYLIEEDDEKVKKFRSLTEAIRLLEIEPDQYLTSRIKETNAKIKKDY